MAKTEKFISNVVENSAIVDRINKVAVKSSHWADKAEARFRARIENERPNPAIAYILKLKKKQSQLATQMDHIQAQLDEIGILLNQPND